MSRHVTMGEVWLASYRRLAAGMGWPLAPYAPIPRHTRETPVEGPTAPGKGR